MMKQFTLICGLFLWAFSFSVHSSAVKNLSNGDGQIRLYQSKGQLVSYDKRAVTLFIADPAVADFTIKSAGLMYLLPKKLGETNLIGIDKDNQIIFSADVNVGIDKHEVYKILRSVAPGSRVNLESFGDSVVLKGLVQHPSTLAKISTVLKSYLDGTVLHNFVKVASPAQIYLQVKVVEISRNVSDRIGISWSAAYGSKHFNVGTGFGGGGGNGVGGGLASSNLGFQFSAYLEALAQRGLATILAEPNLTTLSGTTADFLAGGQFPIPVSQALGVTTIQFQSFGAAIGFTPTLVNKDLINLKVNVDVSSLSNNGAIQTRGFSVPALSTRSANVSVQLKSGESMAIGGLLQKEIRKAVEEYPGLAELPILGPLFQSKGYANNETELVIIVTPYLVKPSGKKLATPIDSLPNPFPPDKFGKQGKGLIMEKG